MIRDRNVILGVRLFLCTASRSSLRSRLATSLPADLLANGSLVAADLQLEFRPFVRRDDGLDGATCPGPEELCREAHVADGRAQTNSSNAVPDGEFKPVEEGLDLPPALDSHECVQFVDDDEAHSPEEPSDLR